MKRIINLSLISWSDGPDLPQFYTDEPARPCSSCRLLPKVGRTGGVFRIRCVNVLCAMKPVVTGRDEQQVRGVWLTRYALKD